MMRSSTGRVCVPRLPVWARPRSSKSLRTDGEKSLAHLKTLKGAAFDKAYIDREVSYHQQVIDALDKTLIPGAFDGPRVERRR